MSTPRALTWTFDVDDIGAQWQTCTACHSDFWSTVRHDLCPSCLKKLERFDSFIASHPAGARKPQPPRATRARTVSGGLPELGKKR